MANRAERRRALPSVDRVLSSAGADTALARYQRRYVVDVVHRVLDDMRRRLATDPSTTGPSTTGPSTTVPSAAEVMAAAFARMESDQSLALRPVVNATGVVLHTNLGRALLADAAISAVTEAARSPVTLEYDVDTGARGDRDDLVADDLCALTGAEAATVVNNNAVYTGRPEFPGDVRGEGNV
jgi:L-seryl-tRNA(Ser) seleniumtransferase